MEYSRQLVRTDGEFLIIIIIDAIDQCEENTRSMILRYFFDLIEFPTRATVKFFIISRFGVNDIQYFSSHLLFLFLDSKCISGQRYSRRDTLLSGRACASRGIQALGARQPRKDVF